MNIRKVNFGKKIETEKTDKAVNLTALIKEQTQILANKFADLRIKEDDMYVEFASTSPNFYNQLAVDRDTSELFRIVKGVYRKEDNMGRQYFSNAMDKKEVIQYLTSIKGIAEIEDALKRLLDGS